jgi:hypothetical protein
VAKWTALEEMMVEEFYIELESKLVGQVNLVRIGMYYLNDGGSFTLSTGILADDPVDGTTSPDLVNGGIHSFVKAAALEPGNRLRINVISSGLSKMQPKNTRPIFPNTAPYR